MEVTSVKKKNVSKRNKSSWRKYIDTSDVDGFLDEKRLEERLGATVEGKDYIFDTKPDHEYAKRITKKIRAQQPPECFKILSSYSAVPDPITKRNRVRTKEERKHPIRRKIEAARLAKGILPKRVIEANIQRRRMFLEKKRKPKGVVFVEDIWDVKDKTSVEPKDAEWLSEDTLRHTLTNTRSLKVKVPKAIQKKKSVIPPIENPHPGISYNPSFQDHQDLLNKVVEKEVQVQKEEEHIARVTTQIFKKVTPAEREAALIAEMTQGLFKEENEEKDIKQDPESSEYKALNPPTSVNNRKTLKQRRKQKELREAALSRKQEKIEKKKLADIYKLRFLNKDLESSSEKQAFTKKKKLAVTAAKLFEPKRLGPRKFVAPDIDFNRGCDLRGNLRSILPEGSLLSDRFYSMQKRNILAPTVKINKIPKQKTKRVIKSSFKEEDPTLHMKKKPKRKK